MGCGCGGSTYGETLNAENAPAQTDGYYWTGVPAETPKAEPDKAPPKKTGASK